MFGYYWHMNWLLYMSLFHLFLWCQNRWVKRTRTDGVDADLAMFQVDGPGTREGPYSNLGCAVNSWPFDSFGCAGRSIWNNRTAILKQRKRFLYREQQPFHVDAEYFIKMWFGKYPQGCEFQQACIGKEDIDSTVLPLHRGVQMIKICEIWDVTLNTGDFFADLLDSCIKFALAEIVDKNVRALCDESLCCGEAYATVSAVMTAIFPSSLFMILAYVGNIWVFKSTIIIPPVDQGEKDIIRIFVQVVVQVRDWNKKF